MYVETSEFGVVNRENAVLVLGSCLLTSLQSGDTWGVPSHSKNSQGNHGRGMPPLIARDGLRGTWDRLTAGKMS